MDPLDHPCPRCHAHRGERCAGGGPPHPDRRALGNIRELRHYDLDPSVIPDGHDDDQHPAVTHRHSTGSIPPDQGRQIAYHACVDELTRRGHPNPHARATELLHHWLG